MWRIVLPLELLYMLVAPTAALAWSDSLAAPDGWAWAQILARKVADFNEHCGVTLDPQKPAGWDDPCRQISPEFLVEVLTVSKWKERVPLRGVRLRGAHIVGDILLNNAEITQEFWLDASLITGAVILMDAHVKRVLSFDGSVLGSLNATRMNTESLVTLERASFRGNVKLDDARIGDDLDITFASFSNKLNAERLNVHGDLHMYGPASFSDDVTLRGTTIDGNLDMEHASFSKKLNADLLAVHGTIDMSDHASFGDDVTLRSTAIDGNLDMDSASFAKMLDANRLSVHGSLHMRDHASFGDDVILIGATIDGNLEMSSASFSKKLEGYRLRVHGSLFMRNHASFGGDVDLSDATVDQLDLRTATASSIDLSNLSAGTGSELQLAGMSWRCRQEPKRMEPIEPQKTIARESLAKWPLGDTTKRTAKCDGIGESLPRLILRNTHIESLQDDRESWPPLIDLEGLRYDRFSHSSIDTKARENPRTREAWVDWLARNRDSSQQPYKQLAAELAATGQRDMSEAILFAGRERERDEIWSNPSGNFWQWVGHNFWPWVWLSILSWVAGYGIGLYTFRVLWWVVGLTILGTVVLRYSPYAREHSVAWRFGASLHRLLPIVQLNKEFEDFFDNIVEPCKPLKFRPWQMAFFSGIALAGWVLGFFLLAAMGGLIQK